MRMSRVKGLTCQNFHPNEDDVLQSIFIELAILDFWILLKVRKVLNDFLKFLIPALQIVSIMTLGAGLLLVYTLNEASNEWTPSLNSEANMKSVRRLDDRSKVYESKLEKELFSLKRKTLSLDLALRRMDSQLKNLQTRQNVELADFAAESVGGFVIATPDTESFYELEKPPVTLLGIPIWKPNYFTPRKVIQPWTQAGECWAFRGSFGKIEIELPYSTIVSHVTMEHIPVSLSITGTIDSAPKEFQVSGKYENTYTKIDQFVYNIDGPPSQTFMITNAELQEVPLKRIILEILSNWGNREYTCIYRFKVHGKLFEYVKSQLS